MTFKRKSLATFIILMTGHGLAQATGTFLPQITSNGAGLAGAGDAANTSNAAVMWANPAAMAALEGEMLTVNALLFDINLSFEDQGSTLPRDSKNAGDTMPAGSVFWHKPVNDKVSLGLALGSLGGSALDYGSWAGASMLKSISSANIQFNPSLSYRINDQWSLGGGIQINYTTLEMDSSLASMEEADDWGTGFNAGVFYQPTDQLQIGLSYRSAVDTEFEGKADVLPRREPLNSISYRSELPFVDQASLAGSYQLNDHFALLGSIGWQQWSDFDSTAMELGEGGVQMNIDRDWKDVWSYGVGVEFKPGEEWTFRTGVSYYTSSLDDPAMQYPDLPADRQIRYAVGAGRQINQWQLDFYYEYLDLGTPEIDRQNGPWLVKGEYDKADIQFVGMSISRKL